MQQVGDEHGSDVFFPGWILLQDSIEDGHHAHKYCVLTLGVDLLDFSSLDACGQLLDEIIELPIKLGKIRLLEVLDRFLCLEDVLCAPALSVFYGWHNFDQKGSEDCCHRRLQLSDP